MKKRHPPLALLALTVACSLGREEPHAGTRTTLSVTVQPIAAISVIDADTLSDSVRILQVAPEPDGGSVAFLFADPAKGITRGLGLVQASGGQRAQLVWPDSVRDAWWSKLHELSFTAGTGQGVRVIIDAHAAQLQAIEGGQPSRRPTADSAANAQVMKSALSRAQTFIDSVRVQPGGRPQGSTLRYEADAILVAPGDRIAAVHVSATDSQGTRVNPTWYLADLSSGHIQPVDSLIGNPAGLPADAARWGTDGAFYYAKDQSIWRARPVVQ